MKAADIIKEARRMSGMSQKELADAAGIHAPNLSNYERGKSVPRFDTLVQILSVTDYELAVVKNGRIVIGEEEE